MNATTVALRAGWSRGQIEFRQTLTNAADLFNHVFWPALTLGALFFLRNVHFDHSAFKLGALALPSILGLNASLAMVVMSQLLTADREDGTLLRAKAVPNGMVGLLAGKIISVSGTVVVDLVIFLIPALIIVPGLAVGTAGSWLTVLWVLALGLVATLPLGAVLGSVFTSVRSQGILTLLILGLIAISGIFYPIRALPHWVQWIAQVFPVYWLGLGMRSALLPAGAVAIEIGHSWRHLEIVGVLATWAIVSVIIAPIMLRRMARLESGSKMEQRREKAMQRYQA